MFLFKIRVNAIKRKAHGVKGVHNKDTESTFRTQCL